MNNNNYNDRDTQFRVSGHLKSLLVMIGSSQGEDRTLVMRALKSIIDPVTAWELTQEWEQHWGGVSITEHQWAALDKMPIRDAVELLIRTAKLSIRAEEPYLSNAADALSALTTQQIHAPLGPAILEKYSLRDRLTELEKQVGSQRKCLGDIALVGQATVIYAQPNTGKTLITLHLLIESIRSGNVEPRKVFYVNMDDNGTGLVEKVKLAEAFGFHMLADGYAEFKLQPFKEAMYEMTKNGTAQGVVVVLDTLKKFVNLMDKTKTSEFARWIRGFVLKGGTVIALAHTNKKLGADGKPIYQGTSDIVDDFDCAYVLYTQPTTADGQKVVVFENVKRRGDVALNAAYSFSAQSKINYNELVSSVTAADIDPYGVSDSPRQVPEQSVIEQIKISIGEGFTHKMKLAYEVAARVKASRRIVLAVIEKYTGSDPKKHHWCFSVKDRGAKVFELLQPSPAA